MLGFRRALLVSALALGPAAFTMHLHLLKSSPNAGEAVATPTREIRLWFSEKPEVAVSTITLLRADSSSVALGKVTGTDDSLSLKAPIPAKLPVGSYIVKWRALSRDGHAVRGSYTFQQAK
ncbi:MAG TPA: copper resistance CopC family protein [Gemmatimonadales bacterium]|jgi:methionine-rich copper-binding protein CopC|nr:copper resistance CopC family protein [Gemmatimonadales bacterium]